MSLSPRKEGAHAEDSRQRAISVMIVDFRTNFEHHAAKRQTNKYANEKGSNLPSWSVPDLIRVFHPSRTC